jgi:hypothetical protein
MRIHLGLSISILSVSLLTFCPAVWLIGDRLEKIPISNDVTLGDVDGDGDLDAFFANGRYEAFQPNTLALNDGTGRFRDSRQRPGRPMDTYSAALGDLDGDGDLDGFVGNGATCQMLENDGRGEFAAHRWIPAPGDSGAWSWAIALGDVDGDGDLDVFSAGCCGVSRTPGGILHSYNVVWLNDGAGDFRDSGQRLGESGSKAVALGDVDGDGDLDAFVGNSQESSGVSRPNQPNKVWLNDGSGRFRDSGHLLGRAETQALDLGDVDGDGDLDVVVANVGPSEVWLNDGSGNFSDTGQVLGSTHSRVVMASGRRRFVRLGDLDTDGDLDAFVGNQSAGRVWLNDGTGNFAPSDQSMRYSCRHAVALGDVDGNGTLDIFAGCYDGRYRVWINNGAGHFARRERTILWWLAGTAAIPIGMSLLTRLAPHTGFRSDSSLGAS